MLIRCRATPAESPIWDREQAWGAMGRRRMGSVVLGARETAERLQRGVHVVEDFLGVWSRGIRRPLRLTTAPGAVFRRLVPNLYIRRLFHLRRPYSVEV